MVNNNNRWPFLKGSNWEALTGSRKILKFDTAVMFSIKPLHVLYDLHFPPYINAVALLKSFWSYLLCHWRRRKQYQDFLSWSFSNWVNKSHSGHWTTIEKLMFQVQTLCQSEPLWWLVVGWISKHQLLYLATAANLPLQLSLWNQIVVSQSSSWHDTLESFEANLFIHLVSFDPAIAIFYKCILDIIKF